MGGRGQSKLCSLALGEPHRCKLRDDGADGFIVNCHVPATSFPAALILRAILPVDRGYPA